MIRLQIGVWLQSLVLFRIFDATNSISSGMFFSRQNQTKKKKKKAIL